MRESVGPPEATPTIKEKHDMTKTTDATVLDDAFTEVDVPTVTRVGAVKMPNPFMDVVKARVGVKKALTYDLKRLIDTDDEENETLKKVQGRARRMLDAAGDAAVSDKNPNGVTVRMTKNDNDWTITFWVLDFKVTKGADTPATDATTEVVE
jgi:hypothetical protein